MLRLRLTLSLFALERLSFRLFDCSIGLVNDEDEGVAVNIPNLLDGGPIQHDPVTCDAGRSGSVHRRDAGRMVSSLNESLNPLR